VGGGFYKPPRKNGPKSFRDWTRLPKKASHTLSKASICGIIEGRIKHEGGARVAKITKYEKLVVPNIEKIKEARTNGSSMQDIADMLGVGRSSLQYWLKNKPEFREAMDEATEDMEMTIERTAKTSLLNKLVDRFVTTEEIYSEGVLVKERKQLIKADTTAIIFALKARNPEVWDPLGVARLDNDNKADNIQEDITNALNKYVKKMSEGVDSKS